jgi:PKD repeat protein
LFFALQNFSYSQSVNKLDAESVLNSRGEVYFYFKADVSEISQFTKILSVDGYDGKIVYAYANQKQFEKFLKTGKEYALVEDYYRRDKAITMATSIAEMSSWDRYPTYEVYVEMMQKFATDYPTICNLDTIGYTTDGRLLLVVKISDNVNENEAEPEFLYTGQIHGDELVGGMMYLRLIDYLLTGYGTDTEVTDLVNGLQIYINPLSNPDGTYYGGNSSVADSRRNNAQDIDMNRNYPDPLAGEHPDGEVWATETVEFMNYVDSRNFVMAANSHAGAELLNYPFDTYATLPADNDWWVLVCREYADMVHTNAPSGYFDDTDNGVTNGYAWYQVTGGRQDYSNYFHNCREVTIELSADKLLDSELLPDFWNYHRQSMIDYLKQSSFGLGGIVTDSITGEPLVAMVYIEGHDFFNSQVYSFPQFGDYYRFLFQGSYDVTFSCLGYKSKTITVDINNYEKFNLDVELANVELIAPTANFVSNFQSVDCNSEIEFQNTSEASVSTTYLWDFGDGTSSTETNPTHIYQTNGNYDVKLLAQNEFGEDSIIKQTYISVNLSQMQNIPSYVICATEGSVIATVQGTGDIYWYTNLNDVNEIFIGNSYETPIINTTTSYFVQDNVAGDIFVGGEPNNSVGGSYITNSTYNYLEFDCLQECILQSVLVYAQGAGNRTINLQNSNGETIETIEVFINDGEQVVELNLNLPAENGLRLGCDATANLYRGSAGFFSSFDYPFNISGLVSINTSNVVYWNDGQSYYAYFYNWTVKTPDCRSEKAELVVYVNETADADFDFNVASSTVSFTNNSTAADQYAWDFGDGNSSVEINPVHTYTETGTYNVKLTSSSDCGSDEIIKQVVVITGIVNCPQDKIKVFPNPTSTTLFVEAAQDIEKIQILNLYGQVLYEQLASLKVAEIDFSNLPESIYLLKIYFKDYYKVIKVTKN